MLRERGSGRAGENGLPPPVTGRRRRRSDRRRLSAGDLRATLVLRRRKLPAVDELDAIAVRVLDEADPAHVGAAAGVKRRLLGLDADLRQLGQLGVEVVD